AEVAFTAMFPVIQMESGEFCVEVWTDGPLLCQLTVPPCAIVNACGENEKSVTLTVVACAGSAVSPTSATTADATRKRRRKRRTIGAPFRFGTRPYYGGRGRRVRPIRSSRDAHGDADPGRRHWPGGGRCDTDRARRRRRRHP